MYLWFYCKKKPLEPSVIISLAQYKTKIFLLCDYYKYRETTKPTDDVFKKVRLKNLFLNHHKFNTCPLNHISFSLKRFVHQRSTSAGNSDSNRTLRKV